MKKSVKTTIILMLLITALNVKGQELSVVRSSSIAISQLPEYVIITSQNTKLLGGINIIIDKKRSTYKDQLEELESLLQDGDKLRVRNQTDLLNSMSKLGYDYVNAYNANAIMPSSRDSDGDDILNIVDGGEGTFKVNMVFRKKEKFRN
ncbi:hypothetical protein [uncultured Tenacibaculum sp.]|uniref:hypothetical protein n=1 Tax=uncultured Tenacibaculum sp. TaxID=174713 RepID=UPI002602775C|nr:hypothetical protein [uncultured Tenacibaculum sp.]